MAAIEWIEPDWPAPGQVQARSTTRRGGVSAGPWHSLNLATHVGDDPAAVAENRRRLREQGELPAAPAWLTQVHGCGVAQGAAAGCEADARVSSRPGEVCAVLTADCLPVLLCDRSGSRVAAVHAGWRGLAGGVLEQTLDNFSQPAAEMLAWLGPAIGPDAFEVGDEVRAAFIGADAEAKTAFRPARPGHWFADIYRLARQRLAARGVTAVYGGDLCTYREAERFYSFRRDGQTGRMASLIWLAASDQTTEGVRP